MGLPSITYSLCLHYFGSAAVHSYFFHITHYPWVCYSLFLSFRALLNPFAFLRPIYLFHRPVIHYSCRLDLMVFCSLSPNNFSVLLSWASFLTFGFHKKKTLKTHSLFLPFSCFSFFSLSLSLCSRSILTPLSFLSFSLSLTSLSHVSSTFLPLKILRFFYLYLPFFFLFFFFK